MNPEQQYFADGITGDLTTDLSRLANMFVISRNTAFTYRNKPVDTKQIGRELCVRYVLEGSVRRLGNRVRVNADLIDADTDAHLWAERFDRDPSDLFAVQDEITSRIAIALNSTLVTAEAARPTENPDALDYIFRARAAGWKPPSRDKYAEEIRLFECALAIDPRSAEARSSLANALMSRVMSGTADLATADIKRAEGLVGQVSAASPRNALAHLFAKGQVLRAQRRQSRNAGGMTDTAGSQSSRCRIKLARSRVVGQFETGVLDSAASSLARSGHGNQASQAPPRPDPARQADRRPRHGRGRGPARRRQERGRRRARYERWEGASEKLTIQERKEIARLAATARWKKSR